MKYEIKFHPEALKEFCNLDGSIKKLVKKQLDKLKTSPFLGEELGNKNGYDLTGYRKMYAYKKQILFSHQLYLKLQFIRRKAPLLPTQKPAEFVHDSHF